MVSILEYEYSVTHVAAKADWYSPYVRWSRGGVSARSDGGIILWVVGWVCGRGFGGCGCLNDVQLGYFDRILLGR